MCLWKYGPDPVAREEIETKEDENAASLHCVRILSCLGCPGFDQQLKMSLKDESPSSLQKGLSLCAVPSKVFLVPGWAGAVP